MPIVWLITNSKSRSTDAATVEAALDAFADRGISIARQIDLAEDGLPRAGGDVADIVVSLGGDGTANAVIDAYGGSEGPDLLILPGGTMNLLSTRLHGNADCPEIIARAFPDWRTLQLPVIAGPGFHSLVGIIAGPTAHWGEVREDIRQGELQALLDDIPAALEATFSGPRVSLAGETGDHAALFVEAREDGLHIHDIQAGSIGELVQHGWAWLNRDFLGGPTQEIDNDREIQIECADNAISMLVDGEAKTASPPLALRWKRCPANFITTLQS